jgi:uncharacterized protein YgbK (DUF1537 family)
MSLLLTFYGDDFTGSTDALEQLTLGGIRAALFIKPPTRKQLKRFTDLQAIGVAGMTRSLAPAAMERELRPAFKRLKALGARHVHYKVCSTFDSSPRTGSIGKAIDVGSEIFRAPFVPLLVAAPALGRYCVFGNLFARFGIGSDGAIHRLDRHPSVSRHPVTPMTESDLRLHLARQTRKRIRLFDILKLIQPGAELRATLKRMADEGAEVIFFDALYENQLPLIGELIDELAGRHQPMFSVGSSGVEMALSACWRKTGKMSRAVRLPRHARSVRQILVASGSCSPVTAGQIEWALKNGFAGVALDPAKLISGTGEAKIIERAVSTVVRQLRSGRSVIVYTSRGTTRRRSSRAASPRMIGDALGRICSEAVAQSGVRRLCIAGGDTSSFAARSLGIEALEMIASLTPGAPLCRASGANSAIDECELVFKGGQVGPENYFEIVRKGRNR